jgi:hypothetical protein
MLACGAFGNAPPVVGITATAPIHGDRALKPRTVLFSTAGLPKEFAPGPPDPCAPPPAGPPALPPAPPPAADAMLTLAIKSALHRNTCLNIFCSADTPVGDASQRNAPAWRSVPLLGRRWKERGRSLSGINKPSEGPTMLCGLHVDDWCSCTHSIFVRWLIADRNHGAPLGLLSKSADPPPPPRAQGSTAKAPAANRGLCFWAGEVVHFSRDI